MGWLPQHLLAAVLPAACSLLCSMGNFVVGSAMSQQCFGAVVGGKGQLLCQCVLYSSVIEWFKVAVMECRCCKSVGQSGAAESPK